MPRVAEQECREERAKAAHMEKLLERNQIKLRLTKITLERIIEEQNDRWLRKKCFCF